MSRRLWLPAALVLAAATAIPASADSVECQTTNPELRPVCQVINGEVVTVTVESPCPPRSYEVARVDKPRVVRVCRFY